MNDKDREYLAEQMSLKTMDIIDLINDVYLPLTNKNATTSIVVIYIAEYIKYSTDKIPVDDVVKKLEIATTLLYAVNGVDTVKREEYNTLKIWLGRTIANLVVDIIKKIGNANK